jgi:hypothetical protein
VIGLQLPQLTAADPDLLGEGSLDPLGLAPLADKLADLIAPEVSDRMKRPHTRLLTVMVVCAALTEPLDGIPPADGRSVPYLVAEWYVVEALAKERSVPIERVPGLYKARAVLNRGGHLDAASYLVQPSVFGFHGIFKPLARDLGLLDNDLRLATAGARLVEAWETESGFAGFLGKEPGKPGGSFAARLSDAIRNGLRAGRVDYPDAAKLWSELRRAFNPLGAGLRERKLVWTGLTNDRRPIQQELLLNLERLEDRGDNDRGLLARLGPNASPDLKRRFSAITEFEAVASLLLNAFDSIRYASTSRGSTPITRVDVGGLDAVKIASKDLSSAYRLAEQSLGAFDLDSGFADQLIEFSQPLSPPQLFDALMNRHKAVQDNKAKRAWFDEVGGGFTVRTNYALSELPNRDAQFIHPYRIEALRSFVRDLRHV